MSKLTYKEQLLDPRWQKKRLEILNRDEFKCQVCGNTEKTLHVHHFCYLKNGFIWEVQDDALCTLCCDCHEVGHLKNLTSLEDEIVSSIHLQGQIYEGQNEILNRIIKMINGIVLSHKRLK